MAEVIKSYYAMGLYTAADLPLFVTVGYITQADADAMIATPAA